MNKEAEKIKKFINIIKDLDLEKNPDEDIVYAFYATYNMVLKDSPDYH